MKRLSAKDDTSTATTNVNITSGSVTGITDITVADGGTGRSTGTTAYALVATGTTATGAQQTLASGATTEVLVGGGASALPVWTTATGTGAPVRATSPTLVTPALGTPASGTLTNATGLPTAGLVDDAVTAAKMQYGLVRNRQGGTTGANSWYTAGTSNTDTSATAVFIQTGNVAVTSGNHGVTFPTGYNQVPIVVACVSSASAVNAWCEIVGITTTTCTLRVWSPAGVAVTSETVSWIAIGQ